MNLTQLCHPPSVKKINLFHNPSNPGIRASSSLMTSRFCWDRMKIESGTKNCVVWQHTKVHQYNKVPIGSFSTPDGRFSLLTLIWWDPSRLSMVKRFSLPASTALPTGSTAKQRPSFVPSSASGSPVFGHQNMLPPTGTYSSKAASSVLIHISWDVSVFAPQLTTQSQTAS